MKLIIPSKKTHNYKLSAKDLYLFFLFNYSGSLKINIDRSGAQAYIFGIYIGRREEVFELDILQRHSAPKSMSDLLIKGVFLENCRFHYQGLIRIDKNADGSYAYQKNKNLVFSPDCFVDSRPFLEILANDVYCTHSSDTAGPSKEEMLYMRMRGIREKEAELLLAEGFILDVFGRAKNLGLLEKLNDYQTSAIAILRNCFADLK